MLSRRSFSIFAALAVGLFTSNVSAQGTVIYWRNSQIEPNPTNHYKISGDGGISAQFNTYPTFTGSPSSLSSYPFGRHFWADCPMDPVFDIIPGTNRVMRVPLLMGEQGGNTYEPVPLVFFGPEFIDSTGALWSNDNADTFFSFQGFRTAPQRRVLYRFNGPMSSLFTPQFDPNSFSFNPFTGPGPGLTQITTYDINSFATGWDGPGTRVIIQTPSGTGFITKMFNTAAPPTATINDPAVSGISLINPVFGKTGDLIYCVAETSAGERGIASFNVVTKAFTWIIREGGIGTNKISDFTAPKVSPDGTALSFTMLRSVKVGFKDVISPTLVRIPVTGGSYTVLWTRGAAPPVVPGGSTVNTTLTFGVTGAASTGTVPANNFEVTGWVNAP